MIEPAAGEHGVWGYTEGAVGGFGDSYDAQVAHGEQNNEPIALTAEDAALAHAVRKSLAEAHIDPADLRAEVSAGRVTLYGSVHREFEKAGLEARVRAVPGVVSVESRLGVSEPAPR
ncbi:MAG: BON domain-containing protein [Polyangiaceae bacterium]